VAEHAGDIGTRNRQYPREAAEGSRIRLRAIAAYYWSGRTRHRVTSLETDEAQRDLAAAHKNGSPIWLKLGLPELNEQEKRSVEGSQPVWSDDDEPVVSWVHLTPVLKCVGLDDPGERPVNGDPRTAALRVLSRVYSRGVYRTAREVWPDDRVADDDDKTLVRLFPIIGFRRSDEPTMERLRKASDDGEPAARRVRPKDIIGDTSVEHGDGETGEAGETATARQLEDLTEQELMELAPEFWVYRANVGVVDNVAITIQLPDLRFGGRLVEEPAYEVDEDDRVDLPERFLPFRQPTAVEIAEGIALHQAASARDAAEKLRAELGVIEKIAGDAQAGDVGVRRARQERRDRSLALYTALLDMEKTIDQLDRQISRLLRRYGSFGDEPTAAFTESEMEDPAARVAPSEVKLRYRYGLEEIRSLRDDTRLTEAALQAEMSAREARDRDRFEIGAALLGALVLIPTLVAGLYGANVDFPGREHALGLWILVATLGFASAMVALAMAFAWTRQWDPLSTMANEKSIPKTMGWVAAISLAALVTLLTIALGLWFLIAGLLTTSSMVLLARHGARSGRWPLVRELLDQPHAPQVARSIIFSFPLIAIALVAIKVL
jgi:hypothetical protein